MTTRLERAIGVAVMCVVVAVAALVTRDFVRYSDHYPYLALDDALGNVSYNLVSQGEYGFPTSPIQGDRNTTRHRGFFNYGPWYFYAGAGLIWMFGYSIELLRSLHLLGILAIVAAACWWFGRRRRVFAGAIIALGLLYAFDVNQWPMIRPDIAVSVFAVLLIVAAGLAIENRSPTAWFVAGLAAGCAAFTHLIAWALVPCCVFMLAIAVVNDWPGRRRALIAFAALATGAALAAVMFYASFGFRVRDHLELLRGYGAFLDTATATGGRSALTQHLQMGFLYLSFWARVVLAGATLAGVGLLVAMVRWPRASRTEGLVVLLPPVAVLCFYLASLVRYSNFHAGYTILAQVAAWWCAGALAFMLVRAIELRRPGVARVFGTAAAVTVLAAGAVQLSTRVRADSNPRLLFVRQWVSIADYIDKIAEVIPEGASVWGSPIFGIDSPGRFDLVDPGAALMVVDYAKARHGVDTPRIAPAYLIWGYVNNRDNTIQALNAGFTVDDFDHVRDTLAPVRYRLIGLIDAAPYGVTRVYQALSAADDSPSRPSPSVSAYNTATRRWERYIEGPVTATVVRAEPVVFELRYRTFTQPVPADRTVMTELPAGRYLLRVRLGGSKATGRTVVAATSAASISEQVGDLGPSVDFSPYLQPDTEAFLVHTHPGGTLYVSQFDKGPSASLEGLDVYRILPAPSGEQSADQSVVSDIPVEPWASFASPGVQATVPEAGSIAVEGNATEGGFQIASPVQQATPKAVVTLRTKFVPREGHVCVGALNRTGMWLAFGGNPENDFRFTVDATAAFQVVFYNCNRGERGNVPSRFAVSRVRYTVREPGTYVDTLIATLQPPKAAQSPSNTPQPTAIPRHGSAGDANRIRRALQNTDVAFRAPILKDQRDGWLINGHAEGRYAYVLRSKPVKITDDQLVVKGVVKNGGITVGLLKDEKWATSINVSAPGPFVLVLDPPVRGAVYSILIAHDIDQGPLTTEVALERIGWAPVARQ